MSNDLQQLDRLNHFQQYLMIGQHRYVMEAVQAMPVNDPVAIWLRIHLRQDLNEQIESELPIQYAEQWRGWRTYYCGDYIQAAQYFIQAWQAMSKASISAGQADVALGLGKAYTRIGHWRAAREWLLKSLVIGRQQNNLFDIVQGYGALGELLLRGGHPQAAYACLSTAYHILPPGSGQRPRQLNYLASALLRCGEILRAESLLMTSMHLAHDNHDYDSVWHALARLQFLRIDDSRTRKGYFEDVSEALQEYVPTSVNNPVALGFLHVGQALAAYRREDREEALSKIRLAIPLFGVQFPYEHWWALQVEAFLNNNASVADAVCLKLLQSNSVLPPPSLVVLDSSWQRLHLPAENGFMPLARVTHDAESLLSARNLFFI
jgi:tetratricopeptide (TPR) repeat protein